MQNQPRCNWISLLFFRIGGRSVEARGIYGALTALVGIVGFLYASLLIVDVVAICTENDALHENAKFLHITLGGITAVPSVYYTFRVAKTFLWKQSTKKEPVEAVEEKEPVDEKPVELTKEEDSVQTVDSVEQNKPTTGCSKASVDFIQKVLVIVLTLTVLGLIGGSMAWGHIIDQNFNDVQKVFVSLASIIVVLGMGFWPVFRLQGVWKSVYRNQAARVDSYEAACAKECAKDQMTKNDDERENLYKQGLIRQARELREKLAKRRTASKMNAIIRLSDAETRKEATTDSTTTP